jgi:hypothetical protein
MTSNRIRLHYFDIMARGESIRMILNHAKVPFDDNRITGEAL